MARSAHLIELPSVILCQRLGFGALFKQFSELLIGHFFLFSPDAQIGILAIDGLCTQVDAIVKRGEKLSPLRLDLRFDSF
jgi:hypothetical protein